MSGVTDGVLVLPGVTWEQSEAAIALLAGALPWRPAASIRRQVEAATDCDGAGILCAFHGDRLIGVGLWAAQPWSLSAYSLQMGAVLPEYRGRGIGALLVERRLDAIAQASGGRDVWVDAATRCPGRLERYGFQIVDTMPDGLSRMTLRLPRPVAREVAA